MVPANRRDPPFNGGHYTENDGIWTLKNDISSPKFYELLINTEIKVETALDLKNFYNHINMCLNAVNRQIEYLLPDYQSIKRHSEFEEHFIPDSDHPYILGMIRPRPPLDTY